MLENKILTDKQKIFISYLPQEILDNFYITGGTALSAFYIHHRISEDLDFFTEEVEKIPPIEFLTGIIKKLPNIRNTHYERLFDRRIFSVDFQDGDTLKAEFTLYPFKSIENRKTEGKLTVDSLLNIVTGKLLAVSDRYDPKDFIDIYFVLKNYELDLDDLIAKAENRFNINGLKFVVPERMLLVRNISPADLPIMNKEMDLGEVKRYLIEKVDELVKRRKEFIAE
jgi:hypothetical protein